MFKQVIYPVLMFISLSVTFNSRTSYKGRKGFSKFTWVVTMVISHMAPLLYLMSGNIITGDLLVLAVFGVDIVTSFIDAYDYYEVWGLERFMSRTHRDATVSEEEDIKNMVLSLRRLSPKARDMIIIFVIVLASALTSAIDAVPYLIYRFFFM